MPTSISRNPDGSVSVQVTVQPGATMLACEESVQAAFNEAAGAVTGEFLRDFDADGSPIVVGGRKLTAKGGARMPKTYQTPYGEVVVERFVYQSSAGGRTWCPMEHNARIVRTATPMLAKQMAFKYAHSNASEVCADFAQHGRTLARSYVREVAGDVASILEEKRDAWEFEVPEPPIGERVKTVSIGIDGTCALFCDQEGWRQVMVGTIAFFDDAGERLDTTYVAHAPESGKVSFYELMERELAAVRKRYPDANYVGVADGAHDQWAWLEKHTDWQVLDFWHAAEYLSAAAPAIQRSETAQLAWFEAAAHALKHDAKAAETLLEELREARDRPQRRTKAVAAALQKAITYFENQLPRMKYSFFAAMKFPIGSGVTEAACKCIVKQRLCGAGMRWQLEGAQQVLSLRALVKSTNRWDQFWHKATRYGFSKIVRPRRPLKRS